MGGACEGLVGVAGAQGSGGSKLGHEIREVGGDEPCGACEAYYGFHSSAQDQWEVTEF